MRHHLRWPITAVLLAAALVVPLAWPTEPSCRDLPEPWMTAACAEAEATHGERAPVCGRSAAAESYRLFREQSWSPRETWPRRFEECLAVVPPLEPAVIVI